MSKPVKVSMTTFVDFVTATGTSRISKVTSAKKSYYRPYAPATDYWLPLKQAIRRMHEDAVGIEALERGLVTQADPKKSANYRSRVAGYRKFTGTKVYEWFQPPSTTWSHAELLVGIAPELGLMVRNEPHIIKLHLKADELSKQRVDVLLHLMEVTVGASGKPALLDVERGKLHVQTRAVAGIDALLRAEANAFIALWNELA